MSHESLGFSATQKGEREAVKKIFSYDIEFQYIFNNYNFLSCEKIGQVKMDPASSFSM